MRKVLLGGILGGIAFFMWGFVSHMLLPIGKMGMRQIPNEDAVAGAMRGSIHEPGFYFFPYLDMNAQTSQSDRLAWEAKLKQGPSGILVVRPEGGEAMSPRQLVTELATDVVAALLAASLLTSVRLGYGGRVLFVTALGVFGLVTIIVPYWNWYGFPCDFMAGQAIHQVVGWLVAGLVLAAIVRSNKVNLPEETA